MMKPERLSPRGVKRLEREEWNPAKDGLGADGLYRPYRDYKQAKGLAPGWTIGVGCWLATPDRHARGLTLEQVYELLHDKLSDVYKAIAKWVTYEYNQAQFDSMVITGHNVGPGFFFPPSCTAIRALNAGDVAGYLHHLLDWNKSGKPPVFDPILAARRKRECGWFLEPEEGVASESALEKAVAVPLFDLKHLVNDDGTEVA